MTDKKTGYFTNATTKIFTIFIEICAGLNFVIFFLGLLVVAVKGSGIISITYIAIFMSYFVFFGAFTIVVSAYNKFNDYTEHKMVNDKREASNDR